MRRLIPFTALALAVLAGVSAAKSIGQRPARLLRARVRAARSASRRSARALSFAQQNPGDLKALMRAVALHNRADFAVKQADALATEMQAAA